MKRSRPPRRVATAGAALLVALLQASPALAQQLGRDGRCTAEVPEVSLAAGDADNVVEHFAIVAAPDLYVGADDDRLMDPDVSAAILMHTSLLKVREAGSRMLVRSRRRLLGDEFVCGWIPRADVLPIGAPAITVGNEIEWTDPVTGQSKTLENPLSLKAMLRSNPETGPGDATRVQIYERPTITAEPRTDASVFGIYLIYAEREVDGDFWFWIAGEEPQAPTAFAGWVPAEHVLLWETQLSLYFNGQSEGAEIYAGRELASVGDGEGVLARRPDDYVERSVGAPATDEDGEPVSNIARFPILLEEPGASRRGQTLYRIGFFGDSGVVEDVSDRGRKQRNVRRVDMLFLLDNTLSMTEYFPYVVRGVRSATERIAAINAREGYDVEVKYAAAVYGDYADRAAVVDEVQFQVISRLGEPGYTEHLARLSAIAASGGYFEDALADKPEAGLAGILRGISDLQWSDGTEFKVIVWIGDHGSRESGSAEHVTIDEVRARMRANDVLLLPINVAGRYSDVWNGEFVRQGNELATVRGLETTLTYAGGAAGGDDREATARAIEEAIGKLYKSSLTASVAIREGRNVDQVLAERRDLLELDIPAAEGDVRRISTAICEMAFGSVGCENAARSGQFMGEGYVRYDERLENYDFWVNLTYDNLDLMTRLMQLTCRGFERSSVRRNIEQAMTLVTSTLGGDPYRPDIPVGEFLRRYLFLPANHFPSILESTPDRIEEQWQRARDADSRSGTLEATLRIADPICRSAELLGLAFDNKRLIDPDTDLVRTSSLDERPGVEYSWTVADRSRIVDFDWEWSQGGENNYFYLPVDFFPSRVELE